MPLPGGHVASLPEQPEQAGDELSVRALVGRVAIGLLGLMLVVGSLAFALEAPLRRLSEAFVARFGLGGVFVATLFTDTFMLTHEPVLFVGFAGGLGFWPVMAAASAASVLAGPLGWFLGGRLAGWLWLQRVFERYRISAFLRRYGFWAVAVAAITPVPFSACTWASGAAKVPLGTVTLGSLFRIPKVAFYFGLIVITWQTASQTRGTRPPEPPVILPAPTAEPPNR